MFMVIAATDDKELNHHIAGICNSKGIMVNAVDQKEDCSFIFSSYIKKKKSYCSIFEWWKQPCAGTIFKKSGKGDPDTIS